ncbi:retrovirus-related Pol polyprotein from transposon opus [Trichonephila clavipes]|nr:retrovirus-related Pol polyprotein from transposon opus [Trichonephila clavipes]
MSLHLIQPLIDVPGSGGKGPPPIGSVENFPAIKNRIPSVDIKNPDLSKIEASQYCRFSLARWLHLSTVFRVRERVSLEEQLASLKLQRKVQAIFNYKLPETIHDLRTFLGMINFYRRYLKDAAKTQAPLHELLRGAKKKDRRKVHWTDDTRRSFENAKLALPKLLFYPFQDLDYPYHFAQMHQILLWAQYSSS